MSKQLVDEYAAAWNSHDPAKVASFFTPDCKLEDFALDRTHDGRDAVKEFVGAAFSSTPDLAFKTLSARADDTAGTFEWEMGGTDTGEDFPGIPATGNKYAVRGVSILEFKDGKIHRQRDYWNLASMLQQLGLMPTP